MDRISLEGLKRSEIQKMAKKLGIKANLKTEKIIEEIVERQVLRGKSVKKSDHRNTGTGISIELPAKCDALRFNKDSTSWKQKFATYTAQVDDIERGLHALRIRQTTLEAELFIAKRNRALSAAWAPWRRLPVEIIGDIINFANESSGAAFTFPTTISCVCSELRAIAIATPHLWTRIRIESSRGLSTARIWLGRAKAVTVNFTCVFKTADHTKMMRPTAEFTHAMEFLCLHLVRVSHLHIEVANNAQYGLVLKALRDPAPNLRYLRFSGPNKCSPRFSVPNDIAQGVFRALETPNLRDLVSPPSQWPMGMTRYLTRLDLYLPNDVSPSRILQLLSNSLCLRALVLSDKKPYKLAGPPLEQPHKVVTLPSLTSLEIDAIWLGKLLMVSEYLDLPMLRYLFIAYTTIEGLELLHGPNIIACFPSLNWLRIIEDKKPASDILMHANLHRLLRRCDNTQRLSLEKKHYAPTNSHPRHAVVRGSTAVAPPCNLDYI